MKNWLLVFLCMLVAILLVRAQVTGSRYLCGEGTWRSPHSPRDASSVPHDSMARGGPPATAQLRRD